MIVGVSIVDRHRPKGEAHVGTYMFEVDYSGDSHFDIECLVAPVENEENLRPYLNLLLKKEDFLRALDSGAEGMRPMHLDGTPL